MAGRASFTAIPAGRCSSGSGTRGCARPANQLELRVAVPDHGAVARRCRSTCGRRRGRRAATDVPRHPDPARGPLCGPVRARLEPGRRWRSTSSSPPPPSARCAASSSPARPSSTGCSSCAPASSATRRGLLSRDFGFRAAVATGDPGTALSALDNLKARLGLRTAFIVGMDGQCLGPDRSAPRRRRPRALDGARRRPDQRHRPPGRRPPPCRRRPDHGAGSGRLGGVRQRSRPRPDAPARAAVGDPDQCAGAAPRPE